MTDLTNKLVSNTYKQLILVSSAVSNTGVDTSLKPVQTGDGTNTALQVAVSAIKVTGDAAVSGNVSVRGNIHADDRVCASAFYGDGSNITGVTATIAGNISVSNAVVGGNLQVSGTTTVVGATHLKAAVSVGGAAQFGSTVTVSGAAQFNSTVTAVGAATFKSTVTVENALAAKNNVTVGGTFNVAGTGTFTSKTEFKNDVSVSGRLDVATSASIGGTFRATGNAGFSGAVSVSGGLVVGDTVTILGTNLQAASARVCASAYYGDGSNLTNLPGGEISGNISVNGIIAGGDVSIAGNLTAVGTQVKFENAGVCASAYYGDGSNLTGITAELITDGRVGGSLAVSAALSVGSTLNVGGATSIGGNATFSGSITSNPASGANLLFQNGSGAAVGRVTFDSTNLKVRGDSSKGLKLGSNGSDVVTIDTSGNTTFGGDVILPTSGELDLSGGSSTERILRGGAGLLDAESRGSVRIYTDSNNNDSSDADAFVVFTGGASGVATSRLFEIEKDGDATFAGSIDVSSSSTSSITRSAAGTALNIISTAATATSLGPILGLYRNNGAGVATHNAGAIQFRNNDSTSAETSYAQIDAIISDPTNGAEDGTLIFRTVNSGTMSEHMRINNSGNVGIGTTAAKEKLDSRGAAVFSGDNTTGTNAFGTSAGLLLSTASDNSAARITAVSDGANDRNLELRTLASGSAVTAMTLDSSGNATFAGNINFSATTTNVSPTTSDASDNARIFINGGGAASPSRGSFVGVYGNENAETGRLLLSAGNVSGGDIEFHTGNSVERMRIDNSGNVGIGTSTATYRLTVEDSSADWAARIYNTGTGASNQGLLVRTDSTAANNASAFAVYGDGEYRLMVKSGGNTGIGTASPVGLLDLDGGSSAFTIQLKETSGAYQRMGFQKSNDLLQMGEFNNDGSVFTPILNVSGNGDKVGISETSPSYKLHVKGDAAIQQGSIALRVGADSNGTTVTNSTQKIGRITTPHYTNAEEPMAIVMGSAGSGYNDLYIGGGSSLMNTSTAIRFYTAADSTTVSGSERMRIDSSGNVGIGTTSFTSGLTVSKEGSNTTDGAYFLVDSSNSGFGGNAIGAGFKYAAAVGAAFSPFKITVGGTTVNQISSTGVMYVGNGSTAYNSHDPFYTFTHDTNTGMDSAAADTLTFKTGGTERLRIDSSGNVGIGEANPSYKLEVNGTGSFVTGTDTNGFSVLENSSGDQGIFMGVTGGAGSGNAYIKAGSLTTDSVGLIFQTASSGTEGTALTPTLAKMRPLLVMLH